MIEYQTGDLFAAEVEALVNTVNCVGVMGRGVALQFKKAFPENFKAYSRACKQGKVEPGRMFITERLDNPKYIINFPTKRHWRGKSRLGDIESGLHALADEIREREIQSIALPPLGSGLGGLHWPHVRSRIESALKDVALDVRVIVFEPEGPPDAAVIARLSEAPEMTASRAALIVAVDRYLDSQRTGSISLLELHKLMYFLQVAGEPLKLRFEKLHYGPYADNLRHVLNRFEGHFLSGYSDGGDDPGKAITLMPGAVNEARNFLDGNADTSLRLDKVAELIQDHKDPFSMELLATVYWLIDHESAATIADVVQGVRAWNAHKRETFFSEQIAEACKTLVMRGWLSDEWHELAEGAPLI